MNRAFWRNLAIAFTVTLAFAILVGLRFTGPTRSFLLGYFAPIVVPLVLWSLERWELRRQQSWPQHCLDALVLVVGSLRAMGQFPLVSGHALFLVYAICTTRSPFVMVTAFAVLAEVVFLKLFVWHDLTLWPGLLAGLGLAAIWRRWRADPPRKDGGESASTG